MVATLVLITFGILILIDVFVFNRSPKKVGNLGTMQVFSQKDALLPKEYYYSKGHTWVHVENNDKVNIGLDGFIINALGNVQLSNFASLGKMVNKGDVLFECLVNSVNVRFRSPMKGIVTGLNSELKDLKDPESWCMSLKPLSMKEDLSTLISSNTASKWIKSEFRRLKDLLIYSMEPAGLAGATMYDGGNIAEGAISYFEEPIIRDFEELFLKV
jgi:glycine cleavage system H lipoate-binding protein